MKTISQRIIFVTLLLLSFNVYSQCDLTYKEHSNKALELLIESLGNNSAKEQISVVDSESKILVTKGEFQSDLANYKSSVSTELEPKKHDLIKYYSFCMDEKYVIVEDLIKK